MPLRCNYLRKKNKLKSPHVLALLLVCTICMLCCGFSIIFSAPSDYPAMCAGCDPITGYDAWASNDAQETHNYLAYWGYPLEADDPFTSSEATRSAILDRIEFKRVFYFSGHGGIVNGYTVFLAWDGYVYSYEIDERVSVSNSYFFVFIDACESIAEIDMASAFIVSPSEGCYVGWRTPVSWESATEFRRYFLEYIDYTGCSVYDALIYVANLTGNYSWDFYGAAIDVYLKQGSLGGAD